jgi:hypothetical protein
MKNQYFLINGYFSCQIAIRVKGEGFCSDLL